jgi:hypothetical protein
MPLANPLHVTACPRVGRLSDNLWPRLELSGELRFVWSCPGGASERQRNAQAYAKHPALLRMLELETLRELGRNGNVRIYIGFEKHLGADGLKESD